VPKRLSGMALGIKAEVRVELIEAPAEDRDVLGRMR
jgi:hypothetical protein